MSILDAPPYCNDVRAFTACKHALSERRYTINLRTRAYIDDSDSVTGAVWTVPAGLTKESDGFSGDKVWANLSGGESGETYTITVAITTSLSQETLVFTITIKVD